MGGSYLAAQFNGESDKPFKYFHKGSMAYIGQDKAAAQVSMLKSLLPEQLQGLPLLGDDIVLTGSLAELVWKFLYLDMQISNRNICKSHSIGSRQESLAVIQA